ncbi:MAG TPA: hypothetical protein VFD82_07170 [Planctomycetota bacterium]|nr:hypothetical protein [Planctomycetota bacterium]
MNDISRLMVAVLASVAAAAAVCTLLAPAAPAPMVAMASVDVARVEALEAALLELRRAAPVAQVADPSPPVQPQRVALPEPVPERIAVDAIEARVQRLEQLVTALGARPERPAAERPHPGPRNQKEASEWILDPAADTARKMLAHETLRQVHDAYTPAMVAELLRIGTTDLDGGVRADVWRFFDGRSRLPVLVAPLVRALMADGDARAREEAADTLGSYLDDPIVEPALRRAAQADASDRVRAKAKRTLESRRSFAAVDR